jgi:hypothetical protein
VKLAKCVSKSQRAFPSTVKGVCGLVCVQYFCRPALPPARFENINDENVVLNQLSQKFVGQDSPVESGITPLRPHSTILAFFGAEHLPGGFFSHNGMDLVRLQKS